jgi:hypothetical protein
MNKEIGKICHEYALLHSIVDKLAYPEKYVSTDEWFSGDGLFEEYYCKLQEKAKKVLDEVRQ